MKLLYTSVALCVRFHWENIFHRVFNGNDSQSGTKLHTIITDQLIYKYSEYSGLYAVLETMRFVRTWEYLGIQILT